ncbi:MAG: protein kinase [Acidobacteriota bacterium]|nr:protein kinase [Acidobacteriota bacterium]
MSESADMIDPGGRSYELPHTVKTTTRGRQRTTTVWENNRRGAFSQLEPDYRGRTVGAYRLERLLGKGGMGSVFLAERDDAFRMKVAVKLLRPDLDNQTFIRRFLHERQIMADLHHPNIARLIDGGTTEDGLPYLVMEYVNGRPIDRYCEQHRLDVSQRLQLFRKVCNAVGFIHRNQIIHRDIKPGNILVTDEGEPVILDFGIAKILEPATGARREPRTQTECLMTPEYASPEQVMGETLTPASDIYSLGILLYLLLTGSLPYRFDQKSKGRIRNVVCNHTPKKPGRVEIDQTVPTGKGDAPPVCRTERVIDRDLGAVVMKALRKEPRYRYHNIEAFSDDLARYLAGFAVKARGSNWRYRTHKMLRRHKWATMVAVSFLGLLAGFAWYTCCWQEDLAASREEAKRQRMLATQVMQQAEADKALLAREQENARLAEERRLQAEREKAQAGEELARLTAQSKRTPRLQVAARTNDNSSKILRKAARERELAQQALRRAKLEMEQAERERRLAARERALSMEMLRLVDDMVHRAEAGEGTITVAEILDRSAQISPEVGADQVLLQARLMNLAGAVYASRNRMDQALPLLETSLHLRRTVENPNDPVVAARYDRVARLYQSQGYYAAASELFTTAYEIRRFVLEPRDPAIAGSLSLLAGLAFEAGRKDKAVTLIQMAVNYIRTACGNHSSEMAGYLAALTRYCCEKDGEGPEKHSEGLWRDLLTEEDETVTSEIETLSRLLPPEDFDPFAVSTNDRPPPRDYAGNGGQGGGNNGSGGQGGSGGGNNGNDGQGGNGGNNSSSDGDNGNGGRGDGNGNGGNKGRNGGNKGNGQGGNGNSGSQPAVAQTDNATTGAADTATKARGNNGKKSKNRTARTRSTRTDNRAGSLRGKTGFDRGGSGFDRSGKTGFDRGGMNSGAPRQGGAGRGSRGGGGGRRH